jgi:hypothetical protein
MGRIIARISTEAINQITSRGVNMVTDIYQLCPPLFALGALRIDSPASNSREIYEQDKEFFRLHPGRRLYIRKDYIGEFDVEMSAGDWLQLPRLHILVSQLTGGIHLVTPIYRGKAFFYDNVETDAEVSLIVVEIARRNGIDGGEWSTFEAKRIKQLDSQTSKPDEAA